MLESYLEPAQIREIYRAYLFGAEAHEGQRRLTGEPYIFHPLAVARLLAEMRLDCHSLVAAILHDVIEDTPTAKEQIAQQFGQEVAELVDGVSKLTHINFESKAQAQAENFRKMVMAMVRDIRVILIKLADRLHNMRTLGVMRPEKRRRIAAETLEIYAPIAMRLGINHMRLNLEECGFIAYHPWRQRILQRAFNRLRGNRSEVLEKIRVAILERLRQEGMKGEVTSREKHLYSIYRKMAEKHLSFSEIHDIFGFRIVVDSVDSCYRVLGTLHNLFKPIPGKFKDYIAIPKGNGYQSLHTALLSPYGFPIEVQIRTEEMDGVAEAGIAAHWLYKSGSNGGSLAQSRAREWLHNLLELQQNAGDSQEFLESVKVDLFPDEVYVLTPNGEIKGLPKGATAVDFAYAVHTDVGNHCIGARIDQRPVPLHTRLHNGQTVEIMTSTTATPNPAWLHFVATGKARATIRNYLKNLQGDASIQLGRRLLDNALADYASSVDRLSSSRVAATLAHFGIASMDELLAQIGLGNRLAPLTAKLLLEGPIDLPNGGGGAPSKPLSIRGSEGAVVSYAKCCRPIPGDAIVGHLSSGRGVVIHTKQCRNMQERNRSPDKWVPVEWAAEVKGEFPVELRVDVSNQRGVLARVAAAVAATQANIDNITLTDRDGMNTTINLTLAVQSRQHLAQIIRRIRNIDLVIRVSRQR
jgi:GTP diphosphokinase / guanosine-3',5'-bis(diphosphate) 3'-diphosphatase